MGITVHVAYALPDVQFEEEVGLSDGACVADALAAVAGIEPFSTFDLTAVPVGVFNQVVKDRSRTLRDGDRVEIYRELLIDPMTARQQRAEYQRS